MNIDLDGVTIGLDDTGHGIPVVLLHGWPDDRRLWRHQVPALAAVGLVLLWTGCRQYPSVSPPADAGW